MDGERQDALKRAERDAAEAKKHRDVRLRHHLRCLETQHIFSLISFFLIALASPWKRKIERKIAHPGLALKTEK